MSTRNLLAACRTASAVADTGGIGADNLWFDVDNPGTVSLALGTQDLARVARIEIDSGAGAVLLFVDASQHPASARLDGAIVTAGSLDAANLSGANLRSTDFTNATLDRALWPDRQRCAAGSNGVCR